VDDRHRAPGPQKWPLAQALEADPGFEVLFDDGRALVLRRRPANPRRS
jgi:hypothetical protein